MFNRFFALTALTVASFASQAATTVIDFNDNSDSVYFTDVVKSDGFIATATSPMGTNYAIDWSGPSNGTIHLDSWTNSDDDSLWTLTNSTGSLFSLQSFDYATGDPSIGTTATSLTVTGTRADGTIVTETFDISGAAYTFETLTLNSSFYDLVSVQFDATGSWNRSAYDNITVSVPEPANIALFAMGLVAAGIARRKRRA